jgi:hypothetical protein
MPSRASFGWRSHLCASTTTTTLSAANALRTHASSSIGATRRMNCVSGK